MAAYVYRAEKLARLLKAKEPVLRLERQFGPPNDYPQKMLETVRKQLPASRAVYRLDVNEYQGSRSLQLVIEHLTD